MNDFKLTTPVALIIFNRPNATLQVFERIAKVKPTKLLVIADGPRKDHPSDYENCNKAREIIKRVDWECEVMTNFSDINLGCKMRPVTGLNWVFNNVEEAIILEDDCIPEPTFFEFCQELLLKYKNDSRISIISGSNLCFRKHNDTVSYHFSRYPQMWGWASWRRFWINYDASISKWPELKEKDWLKSIIDDNNIARNYWEKVFDLMHKEKIPAWDYQLIFASLLTKSMAIIPRYSLISNIGFGLNSGFHFNKWHKFAALKTRPMEFPLIHPENLRRNQKADRFLERYTYTYFRRFPLKVYLYFMLKFRRLIFELFI